STRDGSITPGVRIDRRSLTGETYASPWIGAVTPLGRGVSLRAGAGIYRQEPEFDELLGVHGTRALSAERAYHADVGLEGRIGASARWQTTLYDREDRDWLRLPNAEAHATPFGALANASQTPSY